MRSVSFWIFEHKYKLKIKLDIFYYTGFSLEVTIHIKKLVYQEKRGGEKGVGAGAKKETRMLKTVNTTIRITKHAAMKARIGELI